jgi:large repetitive protein
MLVNKISSYFFALFLFFIYLFSSGGELSKIGKELFSKNDLKENEVFQLVNYSTIQEINQSLSSLDCFIPAKIENVYFQNNLNYYAGAFISIIFTPNGFFNLDNEFYFELSNVNGEFNGDQIILSSKQEFFIPVLNGVIPENTAPGNNYKVRIRSSSPEVVYISENFTISENSSNILNSVASLNNTSPVFSLNSFIKCVNVTDYFFGFVQAGQNYNSIPFSLSNPSQSNTSVKILSGEGNWVERTINVSTLGFNIPGASEFQPGYYPVLITKTIGGKSMTYGMVFLFNTGNTGLGNESDEIVCINSPVDFLIDRNVMNRNYPGSKYSINYGDGSGEIEYTHAQLMGCPNLTHLYENVTCSSNNKAIGPPVPDVNKDAFYFRTDLKLFNKGLNFNNNPICNTYRQNGNGVTKWINVNLAPTPDFEVDEVKCEGDFIFAKNTSIEGLYGRFNECLTDYNVFWEVLFPGDLEFSAIDSNDPNSPTFGWVDSNNNLTIPGSFVFPGCYDIRMTVNNPEGCTEIVSIDKPVKVQAKATPSFEFDPKSPICEGTEIAFNNTSNILDQNIGCQEHEFGWFVIPVAGTPATANGYQFTQGTNRTSTNPTIQFNEPGAYQVVLQIENACGTFSSTPPQRIDVLGSPTVVFEDNHNIVCQKDPANYFLDFFQDPQKPLFGEFPFAPDTYFWEVFEIDEVTPADSNDFEFVNSSNTDKFPIIRFKKFGIFKIKVSIETACEYSAADTFTLELKQEPEITNTDLLQIICSGESTNEINLTSNMSGSTFSWTVESVIGLSGYIESGTGANIPSAQIINSTHQSLDLVYKVIASNNDCDSDEVKFRITVNPTPVIEDAQDEICSEDFFNVKPINGGGASANDIVPANTVYTWIVDDNQNVTGDLDEPSFQSVITQQLVNLTNEAQVVVYTVTPYAEGDGNCPGDTFELSVTVQPKPIIGNKTAPEICSNGDLDFVAVNGEDNDIVPLGTKYTWTIKTNNANITGQLIEAVPQDRVIQTLRNLTIIPQTIVYEVTPIFGDCAGEPFELSVTVTPTPEIENVVTEICSEEFFFVKPINGGGASANDIVPANTVYTWIVDDNQNVTGDLDEPSFQSVITQQLVNLTNEAQVVVYTVTPYADGDGNCPGDTFEISVTVQPKPIIGNKTAPEICSNGGLDFVAVNGEDNDIVPLGTKYTWTIKTNNANITGQLAEAVPQDRVIQTLRNLTIVPQTIVYEVTPISGDCAGETFELSVTVTPTPEIENVTTEICSEDFFNVQPINGGGASASDIVPANTVYTWTVGDNQNVTGDLDEPSFQSVITQQLVNLTNEAQVVVYTVTPYAEGDGNCPGDTFELRVTVNPKPTIEDTATEICSEAFFNVKPINGGGASANDIVPANTVYTWIVDDNQNVTGDLDEPSFQSVITQQLVNLTNEAQVVVYTVTPYADGDGNCPGDTFEISVTVQPKPIIGNKTAPEICSNGDLDFVAVNGEDNDIVPLGTKYTWTIKTNNANITGQLIEAVPQDRVIQTLRNLTIIPQTIVYEVTPIFGDCAGEPFELSVTVTPTPEIENVVTEICSEEFFFVKPINGGGASANDIVPANTVYTWIVDDNQNVTGDLDEPSFQSVITQQLINLTNEAQVVVYTVTPYADGDGNCPGDTFEISVTVQPKPIIGNKTAPEICSNDDLDFAAVNGQDNDIVPLGTKYTWTIKTNNANITGQLAEAVPQDRVIQTLRNLTIVPQTIVYEVTPISGDCAGETFELSVTVTPTPEIGNVVTEICSEDFFNVQPINGGGASASDIVPANTVYTWTVDDNQNVTGDFDQPSFQSVITQQLVNLTNEAQVVVYTVTPYAEGDGNCPGDTFELRVTVNPKPTIEDTATEICSEAFFNVKPINGGGASANDIVPANTVYTWIVDDNQNVTGDLDEPSFQSVITQQLVNLTNEAQVVVYTVTPYAEGDGNCPGDTFELSVTVQPKPIIGNKTAPEICSNGDLDFVAVNGEDNDIVPLGTKYTWTIKTNNANITGQLIEAVPQDRVIQTLRNLTIASQTIIYEVTPIYSNCAGEPFELSVTVTPTPEIENVVTEICSEDFFNVQPINGGGASASDIVPTNTVYTWIVDDNQNVTGDLDEPLFQSRHHSAADKPHKRGTGGCLYRHPIC